MDSVLFFMLGAFGCGSCIAIDLHLAVELFVVLGRVLLLLLVTAAWVTCVSEINRAKRRIALAPSLLRLGLCRASDVLVCGGTSCKLFLCIRPAGYLVWVSPSRFGFVLVRDELSPVFDG